MSDQKPLEYFSCVDGSYIIITDGALHHIQKDGDHADLWQDLHTFAQANPDRVQAIPEEIQARLLSQNELPLPPLQGVESGWQDRPILSRPDGSYVISAGTNGMPYHVPNEGGWVDGSEAVQWPDVHAYAQACPDKVLPDFGTVLTSRDDSGSYIIQRNGESCSVEPADEDWTQVNAYALAFPSMVHPEPPPPTAEELAAQARAERDRLLAATDYLMANDYPIDAASREALVIYRQALRDVPAQDDFPENVIWPEKPA